MKAKSGMVGGPGRRPWCRRLGSHSRTDRQTDRNVADHNVTDRM